MSFHDLEVLTKTICNALVKKPGKLTGAEFHYLRSDFLLSQKALGKLLGCTEQAIAKSEKINKIPKAEDFLLRLLYSDDSGKSEKIGAVVDMLNLIKNDSNTKIVISEKIKNGRVNLKIKHGMINGKQLDTYLQLPGSPMRTGFIRCRSVNNLMAQRQ